MAVNKIQISNKIDQLHKTAVIQEDINYEKWKRLYGWMPDIYDQLHKDLQQVDKDRGDYKTKGLKDKRKHLLKPFPKTSTQFIGWLSAKQEFRLDIYGSDIMNSEPLPKEYKFQ